MYHFEKHRVDSPNGYFKRVGSFLFDFSKEWPEANKYVKDALYNEQNYGHASNKPYINTRYNALSGQAMDCLLRTVPENKEKKEKQINPDTLCLLF